jgi:hypothetical protein
LTKFRPKSARGSAIRILGGFILRHDPIFSREAASEGTMTVSVVQAVGAALAVLAGWCLDVIPTPSVFDIWVKPEVDPPIGCARQRDSRLL